MSKKTGKGDWFEKRLADPDFRRYLEREEVVESFLFRVEEEMRRQGKTRQNLAEALGCGISNVSQIMRRERNMTVGKMVDIAFHLGLRVHLELSRQDETPAYWEKGHLRYECGKRLMTDADNQLEVSTSFLTSHEEIKDCLGKSFFLTSNVPSPITLVNYVKGEVDEIKNIAA